MQISTIRMQIWAIQTGLQAFECKFEQFERDSNHYNANLNTSDENSSHSKVIQTIQM